MSILVNAHEITKAYGARSLFDKITFSVSSGERIGLIGPNGAGKSTLLKIIAGKSTPDSGKISFQRGLRVAYLEQTPLFSPDATVMSSLLEASHDPYEWTEIAKAQTLLTKLSLTDWDEREVSTLSGGWKKRVALGRELMREPDLLLLDEPTNHLDVESVLWLEDFVASSSFATLTITHDRVFLERMATRILELDRRNPGGLLSVAGSYTRYLETKSEMMHSQEERETKMRNTLRREMEWLRRGAKARTTKQQARIQRTGELNDAVDEIAYRNASAVLRLDFTGSEKNPKKLVEAIDVSKSYDGVSILPKLSMLLTPKSRVALLGANGSGKSTLLRMLVGTEQPDTGSVFHADMLTINYFEQNRESLDPETTVVKTVCPHGDFVDTPTGRVHVRGYLDRFLFRAEQFEMPVRRLSGGEQSRLLLARLMLKKSNLLVLDEPTNDLDIATLDVLTDVLSEFNGAVLIVSHDRYFLGQVAKEFLAFGTDSRDKKTIISFASLEQWEPWQEAQMEAAKRRGTPVVEKKEKAVESETPKAKKLSFKEQRELDQMESTIHAAEKRLADLTTESQNPALASNAKRLGELSAEMGKAQKEIDRLYARWTELGQ